jgi:hypothetical protein
MKQRRGKEQNEMTRSKDDFIFFPFFCGCEIYQNFT